MEATFQCSICGDASRKICIYCTKDACNNHLCHRCLRCSECCGCDMPTTKSDDLAPIPDEPVVEDPVLEQMDDPLTLSLT